MKKQYIGLGLLIFSFILIAVGVLPSVLGESNIEGLTVSGEYLGLNTAMNTFDYEIVATLIQNGSPVQGQTITIETKRALLGQGLPTSWTVASSGTTDINGQFNPASSGIWQFNANNLEGYYEQLRATSTNGLSSNVITWEFGEQVTGNLESTNLLNWFTIFGILTSVLAVIVMVVQTKK